MQGFPLAWILGIHAIFFQKNCIQIPNNLFVGLSSLGNWEDAWFQCWLTQHDQDTFELLISSCLKKLYVRLEPQALYHGKRIGIGTHKLHFNYKNINKLINCSHTTYKGN